MISSINTRACDYINSFSKETKSTIALICALSTFKMLTGLSVGYSLSAKFKEGFVARINISMIAATSLGIAAHTGLGTSYALSKTKLSSSFNFPLSLFSALSFFTASGLVLAKLTVKTNLLLTSTLLAVNILACAVFNKSVNSPPPDRSE